LIFALNFSERTAVGDPPEIEYELIVAEIVPFVKTPGPRTAPNIGRTTSDEINLTAYVPAAASKSCNAE
jgi:hypothetical protein